MRVPTVHPSSLAILLGYLLKIKRVKIEHAQHDNMLCLKKKEKTKQIEVKQSRIEHQLANTQRMLCLQRSITSVERGPECWATLGAGLIPFMPIIAGGYAAG